MPSGGRREPASRCQRATDPRERGQEFETCRRCSRRRHSCPAGDTEDQAWAEGAVKPEDKGWFQTAAYQTKTAVDKMSDLWGMITANTSGPREPFWVEYPRLFTQGSGGSFCQDSDEMKRSRKKVVHTQGVVHKARWVSTGDHPYPGMYASGNDNVIVRFSETTNLHEGSSGLLPSVAIKLLRDGKKSENILAMPSFFGTKSWNFFKNPMRTRVEPFNETDHFYETKTIQKKFVDATTKPFTSGLGYLSKFNSDGSDVTGLTR